MQPEDSQPEQDVTVQPVAPSVADTIATPTSTQPLAAGTNPDQPATSFPKKSFSRKKILIAVGAAFVVLLGGGVAGATWWTSPQKAFDDAMSSSITLPKGGSVKGSIVVTPDGSPAITFDLDSKYSGMKTNTDVALRVDAGAVNVDMTGSFATDTNKSVFFKINDVSKTVNSLAGGDSAAINQYYGSLISKIDGKWVEITADDMKDLTKDSGADLSCFLDTLGRLQSDQAMVKDLAGIYEKNKYFSIKDTVGSEKIDGRDSNHYVVALDAAKMKSFNTAFEGSTLAKELKKCSSTMLTDEAPVPEDASSPTPSLEIWVDKWSHQMTKMMLTQDQDGTNIKMTMNIKYNDAQAVTVPKADTQFKDLQQEIQKLQEMFSTGASSDSVIDLSTI